MRTSINGFGEPGQDPPAQWRVSLQAALQPGETLQAWFAPDLDRDLRYRDGLVVLTNRRLLAAREEGDGWETWSLAELDELNRKDHAGVGALQVMAAAGRLAYWRYTIGLGEAARRFLECYFDLREPGRARAEKRMCPTCGQELKEGQSDCPVCAENPVHQDRSAMLRLLRFTMPWKWHIALGFSLTLAGTAAGLVPPYLTMPIMDKILVPHQNGQPVDLGLMTWLLAGLAASAVIAWLLSWARTYLVAWVSERIGADLRTTTYAHLQQLSLEYFGGKRTGDLISRLGTDSDNLVTFLSLHLLDFSTDVLMIIMTATILFTINPALALVSLIPLPFLMWLLSAVRVRLKHGFREGMRAWGGMTSVLADTIPGIRVVKAFAQEQREVARFREANDHVLNVNDRVNTIWSMFSPLVTFCTEVGLLFVWGFGVYWVTQDVITVGILTAFVSYISRFYTRMDSMSRFVSVAQRAEAGAQRIFDILDRVPSVPDPVNPVPVGRVKGEIVFQGVSFRYGNRTVAQDINLTINPGEMIGLVGPSGSGKSTLVNLVCRFYDVKEGAVKVDGVDIRSYVRADYRRNIGLVLQEPFLFYGTIAENIAYGRPNASMAEIVAAARMARAHEFILKLPEGYDSVVGERGQALSGGERQRISIARALLINPQILILDEATSSVDTETEREIQEALDNLIRGRTTIAIAHRLSTLRQADHLVVMENGRVVEVGKHDELLARDGVYARLHKAQLEKGAEEVAGSNGEYQPPSPNQERG